VIDESIRLGNKRVLVSDVIIDRKWDFWKGNAF
jgi:hypothetical protein